MDKAYIKSTRCGYCRREKAVEDSWAFESVSKMMSGKGYCNSSSITFHGEDISLEEYESLMKCGWRRSGSFMYKPDLLRSCCRQYTIRTNYQMFVDDGYYNKSMKKTLRKFYNEMHEESEQNKLHGQVSLLERYGQYDKKGRFVSILMPSSFSTFKFELFKRYQMSIHKEDEKEVNEYSFYNFLCENPFEYDENNIDWRAVNEEWTNGVVGEALLKLQGPVHECYVIDGKVVAIAVLDILPKSISSVYFIWDPDYAHLRLGTVSAIREIVMAELLKKEHYYMGFYIADCEKMVYKAKFGGEIRNYPGDEKEPSWVKLKNVNDMLKSGRFCVFTTTPNRYVDVAETFYGVENNKDPEYEDSFRVVHETCLFPTPAIIP